MTIDTLVFILERTPTTRDLDRLGIHALASKGYKVQIWDLSRLYLPDDVLLQEGTGTFPVYSVPDISTLDSLRAGLTPSTFVITYVGIGSGQSRTYIALLRALAASGAKLGALSAAATPYAPSKPRSAESNNPSILRSTIARIVLKSKLLSTLSGVILRKTRGIPALDYVWKGSAANDVNPLLINRTTKVRTVHSLDYEMFRHTRVADKHRSFTVLIDDLGPLHPDIAAHGFVWPTSSNIFFQTARDFLLEYERTFGHRVVVAAHPRAPQGLLESLYGDRRVFYGETNRLIAESIAVIMFTVSTTLGLVAMHRRPLQFVVSSRMNSDMDSLLRRLSVDLGATLIDLDTQTNELKPASFSARGYHKYMDTYVKGPDSTGDSIWEIVARDIESIPA